MLFSAKMLYRSICIAPPCTALYLQAGVYKSEAAMLELHEQQKKQAGEGASGAAKPAEFVPPQLRKRHEQQ
jgi:hypothetical protein